MACSSNQFAAARRRNIRACPTHRGRCRYVAVRPLPECRCRPLWRKPLWRQTVWPKNRRPYGGGKLRQFDRMQDTFGKRASVFLMQLFNTLHIGQIGTYSVNHLHPFLHLPGIRYLFFRPPEIRLLCFRRPSSSIFGRFFEFSYLPQYFRLDNPMQLFGRQSNIGKIQITAEGIGVKDKTQASFI